MRVAAGLLLGAIAGSFLGAILIRWPQGRSMLTGRSQCDACQATLRAHELVPILSYTVRRGRCGRCGAAIDSRHLAMEVGAAIVGAVALAAHDGLAGPIAALLGWWLLLLAALDVEHHWLPDRLTLPLLPAGLLVGWLGVGPPLADRAVGAIAGFAILWGIGRAYHAWRGREGLGGGDPKLLAALGAWLGWQQLPFILLGAGIFGLLALLATRMRGGAIAATDRLPLGTLMAVTAWPLWIAAGS
ncbi:MAG: A24 family peptidase [Pseudomonadota bacterium]|nr:A24 family peptidase [Pseudomonadota bacterium]